MRCRLVLSLWLVFGMAGASRAQQPPSLDDLTSLDRREAVQAIAQRRDEVRTALDELQKRFDQSIRSDRTAPEQRRMQYDAKALEQGLRVGALYAEATGDDRPLRLFTARQHRIEGTILLNERSYPAAIARLSGAITEAEQLGDVWLQVITRTNLAYGYLEHGEPMKALDECTRADALASTLDVRSRALTVLNLASMYMHIGRFDEAARHGTRAIDLARQSGNRLWEGNAMLNLGAAYRQLGRPDQARATFADARDVLLKTQDRLGIGRAYYNFALAAADLGEYGAAAADMERALPIIRAVDIRHSHEIDAVPGDRPDNPIEVDALQKLTTWYGKLGIADKASQYATELAAVRARQSGAGPHMHKSGAIH